MNRNKPPAVLWMVLITAAIGFTGGCQETAPPEESALPLPQAQIESETQTAVTDVIEGYLSALTEHDYYSLAEYLTDEVPLYRNQTAFEDYVIGIESTELTSIDFDNALMPEENSYLLTVGYDVVCSGSFTDPDGSSQPPGVYHRLEQFTLKNIRGKYMIVSIQETAAG